MFRNSVIMQGIKARYALRQASSAQAKEVGSHMAPLGEFTWELVERLQSGGSGGGSGEGRGDRQEEKEKEKKKKMEQGQQRTAKL
jgi:hypothetical protein